MRANFLIRIGVFLLCASLLGLRPASAITLYDNLDPNSSAFADPACPGGGTCAGPLANSFSTGGTSSYLTNVTLALFLYSPPAGYSFTVSLLNSLAGSPNPTPDFSSPIFTSGHLASELTVDPGTNQALFALSLGSPILLDANTRYWIGLTADGPPPPDDGSSVGVAWYLGPTVPGEYFFYRGSSFANAGSCEPGGDTCFNAPYQMLVEATATPIPATLPLFASGLAGLGLIMWRRKAASGKPAA